MWTVVRVASLMPVPWRNGQGTTRDVVNHHAPDGTLLWQASIATLERDADFSDFTGFDRIFTPIAGGPVELAFDDSGFVPCPLLAPVPFSGGQRTRCHVPNGPAQAFNAVWNHQTHRATVDVLRLAAGAELGSAGGTVVLHCLDGVLELGGECLHAGDSSYGPGEAVTTARSDALLLRVVVSQREP